MNLNKWYLAKSNTKFDLIESLLTPQCSNEFRTNVVEHYIICDGFGETIVWALVEYHVFNGPFSSIVKSTNYYIQYYVLKHFDGAWHYQIGNEIDSPSHHNCPLSFLTKANYEINQEWRDKVKKFHLHSTSL